MLIKFLESEESAHDFIENIISSSISSVTDAPPETRIKQPDDEDITIVDIL
jgi:hypothetical protein